jgi:O-antigen ligase
MVYWNQSPSRASPDIYRSFSFEMNPLFFATVTSMLLPYAVARFGISESWQGRFAFGAAACICVAGIVTTFSRGALLAIALSMIGLAVMLPRVRYIVGVPLALGVLSGLAALPWLGSAIWARLTDFDNVSLRFKLWLTAWYMFLDNPLTGVGLNGFAHNQLSVMRSYEIGPFPEYSGGELENIATADNTFLQLAAETGMVGAGAFVAMFGTAGASVKRNLGRHELMSRVIVGSTAAAAIAYLINGITINGYTAYAPTIILSVLLAITASIDDAASESPPTREEPLS